MPMGKRSTLAAAADRLDRMVQEIKRQQYEATGLRRIPLPPRASPDPQANWTKRVSAWTLTTKRGPATAPADFVLPLPGQPKKPGSTIDAPVLDVRPLPAEKQAPYHNHIGAILGKAGPRPGLLHRLFRRDN